MGKNVIEIERFPATNADVTLKRPVWKTVAITAAITFVAVSAIAAIASYFYWQHLKTTPQYSLALIVDAAITRSSGIPSSRNFDIVVT